MLKINQLSLFMVSLATSIWILSLASFNFVEVYLSLFGWG